MIPCLNLDEKVFVATTMKIFLLLNGYTLILGLEDINMNKLKE